GLAAEHVRPLRLALFVVEVLVEELGRDAGQSVAAARLGVRGETAVVAVELALVGALEQRHVIALVTFRADLQQEAERHLADNVPIGRGVRLVVHCGLLHVEMIASSPGAQLVITVHGVGSASTASPEMAEPSSSEAYTRSPALAPAAKRT